MNNDTLTKEQLSHYIHLEAGIPKTQAAEIVGFILSKLRKALKSGDSVKINSFGTFCIRSKKARIGRNPKTKKEFAITARKVIRFYASGLLKKQINKNNFSIG